MLIKAVERLYKDRFSSFEYKKCTDPVTHITSSKEVEVLKDIPCRCSYSSDNPTAENDGVHTKEQSIKLITGPQYIIKAGTKIVVTKSTGQKVADMSSGQPNFYPSHQEVNLVLFERWA